MAVVAGVISGVASLVSGMAAMQQAEYQAQVAKNNSIIAQRNAEYARDAGMREEESHRLQVGNLIAKQLARQGASGVAVEEGSPLRVRADARRLGELDALTIRNNAVRKANDYLGEKMNFEAQSDLYKMEGQNSMIEGFLGGVGSMIGAFGGVAGKWSSWQNGPSMVSPYVSTSPSMTVPTVAPTTRDFDYKMWN